MRELRRAVGQLAIVGFPGHTVPQDLRHLAREFDLAGVIYFARNVAEPAQVAELSRECAELRRETPLWISVDQEGGRVARMRAPFTVWPPMLALGRSDAPGLVEAFGTALAAEMRAVGVNLDFTPVLDILTNAKNPVIGDRSLGTTPETVTRTALALMEAMHAGGVATCGKHFPGHGDTSVDSHFDLPLVEHPPDRLRAVEFAPFRAAIAAGIPTLMTAHLLVPALDETVPATLSSRVVTDVLKGELGFGGVVFTDDLGMKAVAAQWPLPEALVAAIAAGCDVGLLCNSTQDEQLQALEAVVYALEDGRLSRSRVEDAIARQHRVKARFASTLLPTTTDLSVVGRDTHQAVAARMAAFL